MVPESSVINIQNLLMKTTIIQAMTEDRGHLAPVLHARSQSCSDATFTLTNAAPQEMSFNRGQWRKTEKAVAEALGEKCKGNSAFIVTGVAPGANKLNNRVNIPSHFWTAYCCLDNNLKVTASGAFIGENAKGVIVEDTTIKKLDRNLTDLYGKRFHVFGSNCN